MQRSWASLRLPRVPLPPELVYVRRVPPEIVVYMTWMCINATPDGAHLVHPLEELDIVCFSAEVSKGVLHGVELQQLHVTHR